MIIPHAEWAIIFYTIIVNTLVVGISCRVCVCVGMLQLLTTASPIAVRTVEYASMI